jgi:nucleoid DNA-binding protein
MKVIGITELTEKLAEHFPKINKSQLKEVIKKLLEEIKRGLINDEKISFKEYFSLYRGRTEPKGSKRCDKHEKAVENYRRANKGKGIEAYSSSDT